MGSIEKSLELLASTIVKKNQDYASTLGVFGNFEQAAEFARISTDEVILAQIAIKFTRIRNLLADQSSVSHFESIRDSLLDLAGYAIIAHAHADGDIPF